MVSRRDELSHGRGLALAAAAGLALSCGGEPPNSEPTARCVEPASGREAVGTRTVDDPGSAPVRTVTEARSVGTAVDEPAEQLGLVSDVDRDTAGTLYVADAHAKKVLVFSGTGSRLRSIGQKGEGPGEFDGLLSLVLTDAGRLRVFDAGLWRETVFDRSGTVIDTHGLPQPPQFGQMPRVDYDRGGTLYNTGYRRFASTLKEALGRGSEVVRGSVTVDRWSVTDRAWETLVTVPSIEVYFTGGGLRDAPFAEQPLWSAVPSGGVWYADSGEYHLLRLSAAGDTLCRVRVAVSPPAVSDDARDAYLGGADLEDVEEGRLRRIRERRREMPIPDRRPVLADLVASRGGGVWVRPAPRRWGSEPDSVRWHVYSSTGTLEARVRLPGDFTPARVSRNVVVGVQRGAVGLNQVVVLER